MLFLPNEAQRHSRNVAVKQAYNLHSFHLIAKYIITTKISNIWLAVDFSQLEYKELPANTQQRPFAVLWHVTGY